MAPTIVLCREGPSCGQERNALKPHDTANPCEYTRPLRPGRTSAERCELKGNRVAFIVGVGQCWKPLPRGPIVDTNPQAVGPSGQVVSNLNLVLICNDVPWPPSYWRIIVLVPRRLVFLSDHVVGFINEVSKNGIVEIRSLQCLPVQRDNEFVVDHMPVIPSEPEDITEVEFRFVWNEPQAPSSHRHSLVSGS
jgi:hypothetical protein